MMLPLLPGTDGVDKMSKSLGNYIGIHEAAQEILRQDAVDSRPDDRAVSDAGDGSADGGNHSDGRGDLKAGTMNPRDAKRRLARELVALYHSREAAEQAEAEFDKLFCQEGSARRGAPSSA